MIELQYIFLNIKTRARFFQKVQNKTEKEKKRQ